MNTRKLAASVAALLLATLGASAALAADASATSALGPDAASASTPAAETGGKTRAQVLAELKEAERTGDDFRLGFITMKMREAYPDRYPQPAEAKTR